MSFQFARFCNRMKSTAKRPALVGMEAWERSFKKRGYPLLSPCLRRPQDANNSITDRSSLKQHKTHKKTQSELRTFTPIDPEFLTAPLPSLEPIKRPSLPIVTRRIKSEPLEFKGEWCRIVRLKEIDQLGLSRQDRTYPLEECIVTFYPSCRQQQSHSTQL